MHRFYVSELGQAGGAAPLPPDEAQHLIRVLRLGAGARVRVFDGRGREHEATVETLSKHGAILRIGAQVPSAPEPAVHVTLAQALLKGDRFDDVIRDATMLGVSRVQPIASARTEAPGGLRGGRVDRWRRIAVSSAKQCGRAVVPEVASPVALDTFLGTAEPPIILLAEPSADVETRPIPEPPARAIVLVGPEGGWSPEEVQLAHAAGAVAVRIGARTLRADAVALVALSVLLHQWNAL